MNLYKNHSKLLLSCCLLIFISFYLEGQENEKNNQSDTTDTYNFIENNYRTRKSIFAVSLYTNSFEVTLWDNSIIDGKTGYGIHASFEYKLAGQHSLGLGNQLFIDNKRTEHLKVYFAYKYYHNLKKRMQLGKTGDNFSANYIFIEPVFMLNRSPYQLDSYTWDFSKGEWKMNYKKSVSTFTSIWVGYGLHRNFTSNFYFDANAGVDFQDIERITSSNFHLFFFTQLSIGYIIH